MTFYTGCKKTQFPSLKTSKANFFLVTRYKWPFVRNPKTLGLLTLRFDEIVDDIDPLSDGGEMKESGAVCRDDVGFGTARNEELDHLQRTALSLAGAHQRSTTSGVATVQIQI